MKKTLAALAAATALTAFALPAAAQATYPYRNEIAVSGSWEDLREPENVERSSLILRYGRFVRPQLVGTFSLQRDRLEGAGADTTNTAWTVGAKYYFNPPRNQAIVPFVDAGVGFATVDTGTNDSTDFTWQIGGGASWFFTEATSFDAALQFFHTDTDIETKGTRILIGLTTRF